MNSFTGKQQQSRQSQGLVNNTSNELDKYNVRVTATATGRRGSLSQGSGDRESEENYNVPGRAVFLDDETSPGAIMRTTEVYVRMDRGRSRGRVVEEYDDMESLRRREDESRRRLRPGMENAI